MYILHVKVDELANLDDVGDEDAGGKREVSLYVARHRFQPLLISMQALYLEPPLGPARNREKGRASEQRFCQMSPPMLLQISPLSPRSLALAVIRDAASAG